MIDIDLAYVAGLVDADGSICIGRNKQALSLSLVVCNTHTGVLHWLQANFGGSVYLHDRKYEGRRQTFAWHLWGSKVKKALEEILPYLRIKAEQASLALTFPITTQGGKHSKGTREQREAIRAKMQELNWSWRIS